MSTYILRIYLVLNFNRNTFLTQHSLFAGYAT